MGAGVGETLFTTGHLSQVVGVRLVDGREVVVKIRPAADRLHGCADVHGSLWRAGFPCPQPLVGPVPLGDLAVSAECLVAGGDIVGIAGDAVGSYAQLLADLIRLAPAPSSIRSLEPNPPWVDWDHDRDGVWPLPDDSDVDLNDVDLNDVDLNDVDLNDANLDAHPESAWLDEIGRRVRHRLRPARAEPVLVGHGDWEAQNLRWRAGQPLAVHDWDSVVSGPEPVIVGLAASVWPCGAEPRAASVDESEAFVEAYQRAAGRTWSAAQIQLSWAAGLWVYAFNAKKAGREGGLFLRQDWLQRDEATERLRRAGA